MSDIEKEHEKVVDATMTGVLQPLEVLRFYMAKEVIEAIKKGKRLDDVMQNLFDMVTFWHRDRIRLTSSTASPQPGSQIGEG